MDRRHFITSAIVSAICAGGSAYAEEAITASNRQYYELRRYNILVGPQKALADSYFRDALIPALSRVGIGPVGVFNTVIGKEGPSCFVLMPSRQVEILATLESRLVEDAEYQKAGLAFLKAPASAPGFVRFESSLLYAMEALPKLTPPPKGPRFFELRTYESATDQDHRRKVEMMNAGELSIFKNAAFWPVFMADTLIGSRQPNITYMLSFRTLADSEKSWSAFLGSTEWKALNSNPRYAFEPLVSNVDTSVLAPAPYSQI